ncbi:MAG: CoB--CoM heterodisulfide reductase iron-sulfur subunit A family protein [Deltaproteobacteria bacterium]|nr:CoB--CoM heterodisulfide reductase iron-sulfur subunit A family protein [Deltaproteobacteria bacterium]MBW1870489.1 CoB--CoM heterodisulfide reductase iron-sulfur subunit A family protein [Deltaproteobacteria bacterium]
MNTSTPRPLLVIGAGIAGVTAACEAAETGYQVILVESEPSIGGRVVRNHNYFPKMCPPTCGMEINIRRLERNPLVRVITSTRVSKAERDGAGWKITLTHAPKYVNERCTACGDCSKVCTTKVADPFNFGMNEVLAIRLPHLEAWPRRFILDLDACSQEELKAMVAACKYEAIDLEATETEETLEVAAVIVATGWKPYAVENLDQFGAGQIKDVISNVQMERLVAETGPTHGKILKPSNDEAPKKVAFVQCAGSRDVNHLAYCSGVCCMASLKQAIYVKDQLPECEVVIYYIDRRTPGRNEDMLTRVAGLEGVKLVKGKVGKITQAQDGQLALRLEDVEAGQLLDAGADLVVLATGMQPNLSAGRLPFDLTKDSDGFGLDDSQAKLFVAGVSKRPEDVAASVRDATAAAARAAIAIRSA